MGDYANLINQYGGTIAQGIGTVGTAVGQIQAGKQQKAISHTNAQLAELEARGVILHSGEDQQRLERQRRQSRGSQEAAIAGSNVAQSGSALDALSDTDAIFNEDTATLRNNAARQAWGLQTEAQLSRYAGQVAGRNSTTSALRTLATGGLQTTDSYLRAKKRK